MVSMFSEAFSCHNRNNFFSPILSRPGFSHPLSQFLAFRYNIFDLSGSIPRLKYLSSMNGKQSMLWLPDHGATLCGYLRLISCHRKPVRERSFGQFAQGSDDTLWKCFYSSMLFDIVLYFIGVAVHITVGSPHSLSHDNQWWSTLNSPSTSTLL